MSTVNIGISAYIKDKYLTMIYNLVKTYFDCHQIHSGKDMRKR